MKNRHIYILNSEKTHKKQKSSKDDINLIYQFFIHKDVKRYSEIKSVLNANVSNKLINNIYLLNEREYTMEELGINNKDFEKKIHQVIINKRLQFKAVFDFIETSKIKGYCITCNADVFFDHTIENLFYTGLDKEKKIYTQLRFEFSNRNLGKCKLFGPRGDSQDSWIFHTNFNVEKSKRKAFKFMYGKLGCDNKLTYLFYLLGYKVLNEPFIIKSYHNHNTKIRDYSVKDRLHDPFLFVGPYIRNGPIPLSMYPYAENMLKNANKIYSNGYWKQNNEYLQINDGNDRLREFIEEKNNKNKHYNVTILNSQICVLIFYAIILQKNENNKILKDINENINKMLPYLKKEEGIIIQNSDEYFNYCIQNLDAISKSDLCNGYTPLDNNFSVINDSQLYIMKILKDNNTPLIPKDSLNIFNNIYNNNIWTKSLDNKRILIVAPYIEKIKNNINNSDIYGIDLFPNCTFVFIQSPQTLGDNKSRSFSQELQELKNNIEEVKDTFDVALLACNGFCNIISDYIKSLEKSSIVVENLLYIYFGIYTKRDLTEKKDILQLFMNKNWLLSDEL